MNPSAVGDIIVECYMQNIKHENLWIVNIQLMQLRRYAFDSLNRAIFSELLLL